MLCVMCDVCVVYVMCVVCGVVCGVWSVVCRVWCVWCVMCDVCGVCGVWCVCDVWSVVCGVWCVWHVVWCVWFVVCRVWCVLCGVLWSFTQCVWLICSVCGNTSTAGAVRSGWAVTTAVLFSHCSQLRSLLCSCDLLELSDWIRKHHLMGLRCYYGNQQNVLVNVAHLNEHNCKTGECVFALVWSRHGHSPQPHRCTHVCVTVRASASSAVCCGVQ